MKPLNLRANGRKNTKTYSCSTMPLASAFRPTCNICSALATLSRENSLNQHFFIQKFKHLSWNRWIFEPMVAKHQKLLLGNNAPGKCLHAHIQHFSRASFSEEKKFAESAFFPPKIKNLSWNRWIYEQMVEKHQKLLLRNNAPRNISSALDPLSRKKLLNQHFFIQKSKTCHETAEYTSQWWQNTKNYSLETMLQASAFTPTCNISSGPSPAIEKKFAESAFFHTKIKNLSWNRWIYEQMVEKHQKLLLRNNAQASAFTPTCNISSALAPLSRKNSLSQHFFIQKSKTCHETIEFTSKWWKNTKNYSWATMPLASTFRPTCKISSALAPLSRKNTLNQRIEHFFIKKSKTCHETVKFTSKW